MHKALTHTCHSKAASVRDYLSFLMTEQPGIFLSKITLLQEGDELIELEAYYAIEAYRQLLFDIYGVSFPRKLIGAAPKRRSEFLAGRILARAAMERLHHGGAMVGIGEWGAPIWPAGISGSISHSQGKCACLVVANDTTLVGLDVEKLPTRASLQAIFCQALNAEERDRIFQQTVLDAAILATLIFSAKETIYKALYPVVMDFFGFDAVVFNGICGNNMLSLSVVHGLHGTIPLDQEIFVRFEVNGKFVRTWTILERGTLNPFRCPRAADI